MGRVKDEELCDEVLLEVSQVRARSTVMAQVSQSSSVHRPVRAAGRLLPTTTCLGFAAAILTTTPAADPAMSTADFATTKRILEPPRGDAIVLARLNRLNRP
jgi:hypothetical protein